MIEYVKFIEFYIGGDRNLKVFVSPRHIEFAQSLTKGDYITINEVGYKIESRIINFDVNAVVYVVEKIDGGLNV